METLTRLHDLLSRGESARVEYKSAKSGRDALGQAICAFLNSGGGQIVVGVDDKGLPDGDVDAKKIESLLRPLSGGDESRAMLAPNAVWDVSQEVLEAGQVAIIDVPAGSDLPYVYRDGIYMRSGAQTHRASAREIRLLVEKRYLHGARWERQPVLEIGMADLDQTQILQTAKIAADKRGWQFRDSLDPRAILEDLNLIDNGRITNSAVVLFAKEAGQILPQTQVRMTVYHSNKTGATFMDDRVFGSHLFANLSAFDAFIERHVPIIPEFFSGSSARLDRPLFPYWPVREGFRNALMHRDYQSIHGRVSVGIYPQRMEIWNYGGLPPGLTVDSLKMADRSLPVNPDIAQVVFLCGLVELLGRGTRKIVEEFKLLGLPEPFWKEQAGGLTLTLQGGQVPGQLPKQLNLRQVDLLRRMRPGATITLSGVRELSEKSLSERAVRNDLAALVKSGFLGRQGQGKNTYYVRTEKPLA